MFTLSTIHIKQFFFHFPLKTQWIKMKHSICTNTIKAYMYAVLFLKSILYTCPVYYFNINLKVCSHLQQKRMYYIFFIVVDSHVFHKKQYEGVFTAACERHWIKTKLFKLHVLHLKHIFKTLKNADCAEQRRHSCKTTID